MNQNASEFKSLCDRIDKLEAQNRMIKKVGAVALLIVGSCVAMGQSQTQKVVEASGFRLKDSEGRVRAELLTIADEQTILKLIDKTGSVTASFGAGTKGATLAMGDSRVHNVTASLETGIVGATLTMNDEVGNLQHFITLNSNSYAAGNLYMMGTAGTLGISVDNVSGGPRISIADNEGTSTALGRSEVGLTKKGTKKETSVASLVMFNKQGKVIWSAP